jgi:Ribbon-helix-helix protein, copG family
MGLRTVRLDEDTEKVLEQLVKETGLSISAIFRDGLLALRGHLSETPRRLPFEIYETLDLGRRRRPGSRRTGIAARH